MVSSVSDSTSVYSTYSTYNGISGLASGLDTESLVEKLLSTEQTKIEALRAQKQTYTWEQEAYQEVITKLRDFSDTYYDVLNPEDNILVNNGSKTVNFSNSSQTAEQVIAMVVNSDALTGSHTIEEISQLATAATTSSTAKVMGSIAGSYDLTSLTYPLDLSAGSSFTITLDGITTEIELTGEYNDANELVADLNSNFDAALGDGRVVASLSDSNGLMIEADNSIIQVGSGSNNDFLALTGIMPGARNVLSLDANPYEALGETSQEIAFNINGVSFSFANTTSFREIMSKINSSEAGVNISYSTLTDKFTLQAKQTGESSVINIENIAGNFFGDNSYLNISDTLVNNGQDAVFYLDDPAKTNPIKRSSNSFTIDGVTFSLKAVTSERIDYNVEQDTDGVYEKITNYITSLNELIKDVHEKLTEKVYSDYEPLTEAQKAEMTEKQIELWEEKAKSGILRNDDLLQKLENDIKRSFWDDIEGVSSSLYEIGLSSSSDYSTFQIVIDETKLKEALNNDMSMVLKLFNKEEDIAYSATLTSEERTTRYQETGFAQRISDIIKQNITTYRDNAGLKGVLIERAGLEGDSTEYDNTIADQLDTLEDKITTAIEKMKDKEQYYWEKFTAMETALQEMNSQSSWLYSQFSE